MTDVLADIAQDTGAAPSDELASWVMSKVERWRTHRDSTYEAQWNKYYSIWKGEWTAELASRKSERSRLIAPATQQAVDQTVAEMVEATFGRGNWFDISDDATPEEQQAADSVRTALLEDFDKERVQQNIIQSFFNGAIFGTGIAKRGASDAGRVTWEAVSPFNFVIDTAATTIDEALGCAHETVRPTHEITDKQKSGEYYPGAVGTVAGFGSINALRGANEESLEVAPEDGVYVTEYHGKIPRRLLTPPLDLPDTGILEEGADTGTSDEPEDYVEAVVTIGNGATLLKAVESIDRGFVAYQHYTCPNRFWGIGCAEKASNSQAGLDAELRARIDTLALITYPMMGADATRLPKNLNLAVAPGKVFMTNGRPSEIIEAIRLGQLDPVSFQQSADFERMVQSATGANDPATPVNVNRRNETSSGVSMQTGSFIKRAKLTMHNVDTDFLDPLVRKSISLGRELNPDRYAIDPDFVVNSTMSIMAREFEQMQMTNLLAIIPQESAAFPVVLKGIVENYSGPSKDEILAAIDAMSKPDPKQQAMQEQMQMLTMAEAQKKVEKLAAEIQEIVSRAGLNATKAKTEIVKAQHEGQQIDIQAAQVVVSAKQADVARRQVEVHAQKVQQDARRDAAKPKKAAA